METAEKSRFKPGDAVQAFADASRLRFNRTNPRWAWRQVKNNPAFPKPIYIGGMPHFIVRELDEYLASCPTEKAAA